MRVHSFLGCLAAAGLVAGLGEPAAGIEIATGSMLGPRYQQDRFYARTGPGSTWTRTYDSGRFRGKVRGSLALLRLTQALFDDEWLQERQFDPDANTDRLIAQLDLYKRYGVGGIVISLQGSDPGYASDVNGVARGASADLGKKSGALVSAYRADGTLKPAWLARLDRLLQAANQRGLVVCLVLFQQDQDEALASPDAIVRAARLVTRHLIERDARNVILDIADAWDEPEGRWDHRLFIPRYIEHLIRAVREEFQEAEFSLPIGASSGAAMAYPISLARLCDVVLLQGNGRSAADKLARARQFKQYDRPVLMINDRNGRGATPDELEGESAVAEAYLQKASGWSYAPVLTANRFPFAYSFAEDASLDASSPPEERHTMYFGAMLKRVARIVLRRPPSKDARRRQR